VKLIWERDTTFPLILIARMAYEHGAVTLTGLRDTHLDPVQDWCVANKCGRRTAFDTFKFRNEEELTMFLLKWA
jgi:hypothetical protein